MDLRQLRYFVAIAEHGNFRRAAEALNIAQSALSRHMQALGEELGSPLFERTAQGVRTTILGNVFFAEAKDILERTDSALRRSRKAAAGHIGRLSIGVNEIAARLPVVMEAIAESRRRYPEVELRIERLNSPEQVEALWSGQLDLGVVIDRPTDPVFAWLPVFRDPFAIGMREDHPLAAKAELTASDLGNEPFVVMRMSRYGTAQARIFAACRELGFSPRIEIEAASEQMQVALIQQGLGLGLVTRSTSLINPGNVVQRSLRGLDYVLDLDLLWRRDNAAAPLPHFVEIFTQVLGMSPVHQAVA
jgi:DNA-binding transcriptional LysR family regulator